jgi:bis(5'-nucleosyl)-tetraphosphatase (symmetrical)
VADYAIGDIQGCYQALMRLLEVINFDEHSDRLWFVGDLVNRGPHSLQVLRFIKKLPRAPIITLGNHDLHYLSQLFLQKKNKAQDTLAELINAPDSEELGHWLRQQLLLYHDPSLNIVMSHAGIAPCWDSETAKQAAKEVEQVLAGDNFQNYLQHMYGNLPHEWSLDLPLYERRRLITNFFTRMRFCDIKGRLELSYKGTIEGAPPGFIPWFEVPQRKELEVDIVFGHWAALNGKCSHPRIFSIDTGCVWGGPLTALRLQDKQRFIS